jgi:thiamine-phosphate pyrophosphorylase
MKPYWVITISKKMKQEHEERALNKKELTWKKDALDLAEALVEKYGKASKPTTYEPKDLDATFQNVMQESWWQRPRKFSLITGLGYALGQGLVNHLGFEWLVYKDGQGKDVAVKHAASGIIAFPISAIRKRLKTKEYEFACAYFQTIKDELKMSKQDLPKLHYVSQTKEGLTHLEAIEQACQAGCKWVQLRMKKVSFEVYLETAKAAKEICQKYEVKLTINDNVQVALQSGADGLHLGKEDMKPSEARAIVGDIIIGGTANTWEDVLRLSKEPIDYIGLGPLRYTSTKEKLSPILGLEGYQEILNQMKAVDIDLPVYAIGGITLEDIRAVLGTGVSGIAVSGLITNAVDTEFICKKIQGLLEE